MYQVKAQIGEGGEVVLPAPFCQRLDWKTGDEVILRLDDDEIHIFNLRQAIHHAQGLVREHVPQGRSLVDELIAERRCEASRE